MMKRFIEFKHKCEVIVHESDLTNVLHAIDSIGCEDVKVTLYEKADRRADTEWQVEFRATAWAWAYVREQLRKISSNEILIPFKDNCGITRYFEA